MKSKKWVLSVILFFGLLACCPDRPDYWSFESFNLHLVDKTGTKANGDIVDGDSLWVILRFEANLVHDDALRLNGFMNPVYGWSCDAAGELGLIDKIVACTISSDQEFKGIPAGSNLNDLFSTNGLDIDNWILQSGDWPLPWVGETQFLLKDHPGNQEFHHITMVFVLESGLKVESVSDAIKWK